MSGEDVKLPPGLDILWGRRPTGRRGPKAELDVDRIVEVAMEIANQDGLEALSMARVAKALGFTTMSLYRHVANKDELLQLIGNKTPSDERIFIRADQTTRYGDFMQVMNSLQDSGFYSVALVGEDQSNK